jgi:hypothetical protein
MLAKGRDRLGRNAVSLRRSSAFRACIIPQIPELAPQVLEKWRNQLRKAWVNLKRPVAERRRWPRLPLSIPVFVRGSLEQSKDFLEFATALNVSAGGMLIAIRHSLPALEEVSLEIPSAPLAALDGFPSTTRTLRGKVLRAERAGIYSLVAVKFERALLEARIRIKVRRRKQASFA